jgi:nucleoid-associated protein YgaU
MINYSSKDIRKTDAGVRYYVNKIFPYISPEDDDYYIITVEGDRLDLLANQYYGDSSLWKVIAIANNNVNKGSIFPPRGIQLRIPHNYNRVLELIEENN